MTKKKTRLRYRLADFFIVVLCLSVTGYFSYLFWKDLNSSTTRTDKDTIAVIEFKQRIAQRKFSDRVVWERLQNKSPLYNGDTLRTASQSEAIVTFNNNAAIDIHENTMIQIFYSEQDGVKISVGGGDIEIDTSTVEISDTGEVKPAIVIQTSSGSTVNVAAGSKIVAAANEDTGISNFSLKEGNAEIATGNNSPVALEMGETAKIEQNGEVSKGSFTVTSISKNLRILNFEEEAVPVQIEWKATEELKEKPVIIETSLTKDFSVIENTYVVENENNFTLPATDGTIYWRASVETDEDKAPEPVEGKIRVDNVEPVITAAPVDGTTFGYRKELPKVSFVWNGNTFVTDYKLEVSDTPDFASKIVDAELMQTSASFDGFEEGTYYWRVTPFYTINNTGWAEPSKVQSFTVVKNPAVTAPVLSVPANNATLTYQAKDFNVTFLWKSDVKNADYKILVASDQDFNSVVYENTVKEKRLFNNFSDLFTYGTYYWKVVRSSEDDEGTRESEVRKFSVIKYVPGENRLVYPPENYSVEDIKIATTNFMWKLADEYKNTDTESTIQISSDADFKNIVAEAVTKNQSYSGTKLKSGKYYWRIGVYNDFENQLDFTKPRLLNITAELAPPQITYPAPGQEFVVLRNTPVAIKWNPVPEADYYQVTIFDAASSNKVLYEKSVSFTEISDFTVPEYVNVTKTSIRASVKAYTEQTDIAATRQSKTESVDFTVRTATPVKLVTPANNSRFDGLAALRKPIVLEWTNDVDKAVKSSIVVKRVQSNGTLKEVKRSDNGKTSLSLERLSAGTYEWTVSASTASGLPVDAVEARRFTVSPVPLLSAPALNEPKNNFVIGPDYLKKNRRVSFSWKPVPGATDYTFTLNLRKADGTIKRIYTENNLKGTSIKYKQLENLDIGNFEWNVTAYSHAKDGFVEQSGKTATGKFSIKFDLPSAVKTKDPGRVYGE